MRRSKTILSLSALVSLSACPGPEPVPGPTGPEFSSVSVKCESTALPANEKTKCSAAALDQNGNTLDSTAAWSSSNPDVATVDASGNVEARSTGAVELKVSSTALSATREARISLSIVGTAHKETVLTQGAKWTQKDSPHLVANFIELKDGAGLVLEPGAEVRFGPGAGLRITQGTLKASGTAQQRVRLVARESTPAKGAWKGVVFSGATAGSEFKYATLSGCGQVESGDTKAAERACLTVESDTAPVLQQVALENSGSAGMTLGGADRGFTADSTALTVTGSAGYAVRMSASQAGTLPPDSTFTGNTPNAVALSGHVTRTQTWRKLGGGGSYDFLGTAIVAGSKRATLTVEAGATLRFPPRERLYVSGRFDGVTYGEGDLILEGTEAAPVLLTRSAPGTDAQLSTNWGGLVFDSRSSSASRLRHVVVEYGGNLASEWAGIVLYGRDDADDKDPGPLADHLTVRDSAFHGIQVLNQALFGPGSSHLTITRSQLEPIFVSSNEVHHLPQELTLTGNGRDAVRVDSNTILYNQTWRKLSVPYIIKYLIIGSTTTPTLTLAPGVTVMVEKFADVGFLPDNAGKLIARGTADNPILFTTARRESPLSGSWQGLHFHYAEGSVLEYTRVEYAGAESEDPSTPGTGNVNVYREIGPFIQESQIALSAKCGVTASAGTRSGETKVTTIFTRAIYHNTFVDNAVQTQCIN